MLSSRVRHLAWDQQSLSYLSQLTSCFFFLPFGVSYFCFVDLYFCKLIVQDVPRKPTKQSISEALLNLPKTGVKVIFGRFIS